MGDKQKTNIRHKEKTLAGSKPVNIQRGYSHRDERGP